MPINGTYFSTHTVLSETVKNVTYNNTDIKTVHIGNKLIYPDAFIRYDSLCTDSLYCGSNLIQYCFNGANNPLYVSSDIVASSKNEYKVSLFTINKTGTYYIKYISTASHEITGGGYLSFGIYKITLMGGGAVNEWIELVRNNTMMPLNNAWDKYTTEYTGVLNTGDKICCAYNSNTYINERDASAQIIFLY